MSSFSEKIVNWMCFRYGGINLSANIDRSAYCSGEAIAINCRAHNKTRSEMGGISNWISKLAQSELLSLFKAVSNNLEKAF